MNSLTFVMIILLYTHQGVSMLNVPGVYETRESCNMAASVVKESLMEGIPYATKFNYECLPVILKN